MNLRYLTVHTQYIVVVHCNGVQYYEYRDMVRVPDPVRIIITLLYKQEIPALRTVIVTRELLPSQTKYVRHTKYRHKQL